VTKLTVIPQDCPKFNTCSAPICPLDPLWRAATHLRGERVCPYLLGSEKTGAAEHYAADPVFPAVLVQRSEVQGHHPDIAKRIDAAARTPFRGQNLIKKRTLGAVFGGVLG
jgi:hypothetical protein